MASDGPLRWKALLAAFFLFALALAGCTGGDDEDQDPPEPPDEPVEPEPPILGLAVEDPPSGLILGEGVDLNITVTGDNATGTWLGVRWTNVSTADSDNLTTDLFDGEAQVEGDLEFPGTFMLNWTPEANQTYYLRAHAQTETAGNITDHWSEEFMVDVLPEIEVGEFDADHTVDIEPVGPVGSFSPDELEIGVGESVTWENTDPLTAHTATNADHWDTGEIDAGDSSPISVRFNVPGTYEYVCTLHSDMEAEIVVS